MKIEFSLVSDAQLIKSGNLIARKRVYLEKGEFSEVMNELKSFLTENSDSLTLSMTNKDLVGSVVSFSENSLKDLISIKSALASEGINLLILSVDAVDAVNPDEIPDGELEVNFVDSNFVVAGCVNNLVRTSSLSESYAYGKTMQNFLMSQGVMDKLPPVNKVKASLEVINNSESLTGIIPNGPATYLESFINSLGYSMYYVQG